MSVAPCQVGPSGFVCFHVTRMKSQHLLCCILTKRESQALKLNDSTRNMENQNVVHFTGLLICLFNKSMHYKKINSRRNYFKIVLQILFLDSNKLIVKREIPTCIIYHSKELLPILLAIVLVQLVLKENALLF